MPIFFALYLVLRGFSKHPPGGDFSFLGGFIPNITIATDKVGYAGIILIVLYVASQAASTLLMPNTMDPRQRYMFLALPFIFVIFVIRFPVGLMLYWITTNMWTVGQQTLLRRLMPPPDTRRVAPRPSRAGRPRATSIGTSGADLEGNICGTRQVAKNPMKRRVLRGTRQVACVEQPQGRDLLGVTVARSAGRGDRLTMSAAVSPEAGTQKNAKSPVRRGIDVRATKDHAPTPV